MRHTLLATALGLALLTTSACGYLFYPHAKEFAEKAKGADSVETLVNLTAMMEASAKAAQPGKGKNQAWEDLHNQFHAFDNSLCCVEKAKRETPAYALAVTHYKELKVIYKRVWEFKDDQPQRSQHLELMSAELRELRESLQALK